MNRLASPLALLAVLALAAAPGTLSACSCTDFATLPQELEWSSEIYSGTVLSVDPHPTSAISVVVTIRPHWIWRGTPEDGVFRVVTGADDGVCGIDFARWGPETEWLVFVHPVGLIPEPSTLLCGRTHMIHPGDPDIAALGPPIITPTATRTWGTVKVRYR